MKSPTLLVGLLVLLIACGVSFGAGYYVAKEQMAASPTPRTHVSDTGDIPKLETRPLDAPEKEVRNNDKTPDLTPNEVNESEVSAKADGAAKLGDSERPDADKRSVEPEPTPNPGPKAKELTDEVDKLKERIKDLGAIDPEDYADIFNGPQVDFTATVSGQVVDQAGTAVAGASVHASYSENYTSGGSARVSFVMARGTEKGAVIATTDASGSFSATITRKIAEKATLQVSLTAASDGFAESEKTTFTLKSGDDKQGVKLALRGSGSVAGRVVDGSGRGVAGVKVGLNPAGNGSFYGETLDFEIGGGNSKYSATSDSAGEFNITGVAEGRYKFRLNGAGYRQISGPTEIDVKAGENQRAPADFQVAITASVTAKFTDASGNGVQGWATVNFKDDSGKIVKRLNGQIGSGGVFEKNDPPVGSFDAEITVWGYKPQTLRATVIEGQRYDFGAIVLEPAENDGTSIILPGADE